MKQKIGSDNAFGRALTAANARMSTTPAPITQAGRVVWNFDPEADQKGCHQIREMADHTFRVTLGGQEKCDLSTLPAIDTLDQAIEQAIAQRREHLAHLACLQEQYRDWAFGGTLKQAN